jgi:SET domain-containing protein
MPRRSFRVGRSKTGLGLFATAEIDKGTLVAEYKGRRMSNAEADAMEARGSRYMFTINSRWTVDGSSRRNLARYANHSCRPNAESDVVKGRVIIKARKRIQPGDEITYNYGKDYFEAFLEPIGCKCVKCEEKRRAERAAKRKAKARAAKRKANGHAKGRTS